MAQPPAPTDAPPVTARPASPDDAHDPAATAYDRAGRIETRGIDAVPEAERHGRARELFVVWAASNINYLYLVLGGTLVLLGLTAGQAMLVVVAGNLFWALIGFLSVSGVRSGTPSSVVTRALFGVRGNRVNVAVAGWLICIAYEAINLSIGALAGFALVEQLGLTAGVAVKLTIVAVTAVVTLAISVYGHATIVRASGWFTAVLLVCMVVLAGCVVRHADPSFVPPGAPHGAGVWAAAFTGLTIIASGPLSWGTSADYARYLPSTTSARAVAGWTALGGFLPSVLLGGVGVLAATAVDMADPQTSLGQLLPRWFYPIFLLVIVLGSITNNVLTAYSSGLQLQAVGIRASRARTVLLDGFVGVALTCYALFVSNFIDTLSGVLELSVVVLAPSIAVYATDALLRGNRYDGAELHDETPGSRFWYRRGVNPAGACGQLLGSAAALLCVHSAAFTGPVAAALGGADLSTVVGPLVAALVYAALMRGRVGVAR
jgi:NCS1 family nucleobase:cation symporter-1